MKVYDGTRGTGQETTTDRIAVGIAVYDHPGGVGGLLHAMLPRAEDGTNGAPAKYVDAGVEALVAELVAEGASKGDLGAKVAGGSDMLDFSGDSIGSRNVQAARETLDRVGVPLLAEDAGGDQGRSLRFSLAEGVLEVKSATDDPLRL